MATSVFIDLTPSLPAKLAASIARDDAKLKASLLQLVDKESWKNLIQALVKPLPALLSDAPKPEHDLDAEAAFSLIFSLIKRCVPRTATSLTPAAAPASPPPRTEKRWPWTSPRRSLRPRTARLRG